MFRAVLYADTTDDRANKLEDMYADATIMKYPQFMKHLIKDTFPKMKAWSIAHRVTERLPTFWTLNSRNLYVLLAKL